MQTTYTSEEIITPIELLLISLIHQLPVFDPAPKRVVVTALVHRVPEQISPLVALVGREAIELGRVHAHPVVSLFTLAIDVEGRAGPGIIEPVVHGHVAAAHDGLPEEVEAVPLVLADLFQGLVGEVVRTIYVHRSVTAHVSWESCL